MGVSGILSVYRGMKIGHTGICRFRPYTNMARLAAHSTIALISVSLKRDSWLARLEIRMIAKIETTRPAVPEEQGKGGDRTEHQDRGLNGETADATVIRSR